MYTTLPTFVLGFHGCDQSIVHKVVNGYDNLQHSSNEYDWLGHGIYFWENDPDRALEYAKLIKENPYLGQGHINEPAVLGAIIDLGYCLNLTEARSLTSVYDAHSALCTIFEEAGLNLPVNTPGRGSSRDLLMRRLDCAVIEHLHRVNTERNFDTVRSPFFEGNELYPGAGFREKNHIQICVRNPNCIKGYFLPRTPDSQYIIP